jgi:hypothetical protein
MSSELAHRDFGGAVHRRARLAHRERRDSEVRLAQEFLELARPRPVSVRDPADPVGLDEPHQRRRRVRAVRIHHGVLEVLSRAVDRRHLAARAQARVDPQDPLPPHRRRQQQVPQILREHADRLLLGPFVQQRPHLGFDRRSQEPLIRVLFDAPEQRPMGRLGPVERAVQPLDDRRRGDLDRGRKHALLLAPRDRQRLVRHEPRERLAELEVHLELRPVRRRAALLSRHQPAAAHRLVADPLPRGRMLGDPFREDVARAGERLRVARRRLVGPDPLRERPVALLARDLRPSPPLRLEGEVEVLEPLLVDAVDDLPFELRRERALLADRLEDRRLAVAQRGVKVQPVLDLLELGFGQPAGLLLAIAGDEGERGALLEEGDRGRGLGPDRRELAEQQLAMAGGEIDGHRD